MARKTYEARGIAFAQRMSKHFEGCVTLRDFEEAILEYNCTHKIPLVYAHGVSRIAIIRPADTRVGGKIPLYHTLRGFVKHFFEKKYTKKYPKISANFRLVFSKKF